MKKITVIFIGLFLLSMFLSLSFFSLFLSSLTFSLSFLPFLFFFEKELLNLALTYQQKALLTGIDFHVRKVLQRYLSQDQPIKNA